MKISLVRRMGIAASLATFLLPACGGGGDSLCDGVKSVSGFVSQFAQGLDNFSEDRYTQLRLDTLDALDTAQKATTNEIHGEAASELVTRLQEFVSSMDDVSWDVTLAVESARAVTAASALGTQSALVDANAVESVVIDQCGLPTTIPALVGSDTLPSPSIPSPTATDPPDNGPNEDSESSATGQMVATQFGLTLNPNEVLCLGRELQNVFSTGDAEVGSSVYQTAFDTCGINFIVPKD